MPYGDPARLGPFQLIGRLSETPAGITYLGTDPEGRRVSVAVLTRGAAGDAAARDRFRAAILAARAQAPPDEGTPAALRRVRIPWTGGPGPGDSPEVIAAQPDGLTPWVATAYDEDLPGAERFLDAVMLTGGSEDRTRGRRGPGFQPYWIGSREPAFRAHDDRAADAGPAARTGDGPLQRGAVATAVMVAGVLALVLLLASLLYACQPVRLPESVPTDVPSPPVEPFTPPPTPTPLPTPTDTATPTRGQV